GWLPNAYAFAPAAVTALVAATATKVGFYLICRYEFVIFGETLTFGTIGFDQWLVPVGIAGMIGGSLAAVFETDLRRLLAQSSVAQLGYMITGIGLDNTAGATGALVHAFNHALMKGGLFMAAGGLIAAAGSANIDDLRGFGRRMPLTSAAFVVGGLSLIGVPLTIGFVSKWYLVLGAIDAGKLLVAGAFLFASLLALIYVWRVVTRLYEPIEAQSGYAADRRLLHIVPLGLAAVLMVLFGIWTTLPVGMARHAAAILGVSP
ncbi:MAG: monovalent cation/H+ antiporter subunit D family protein, partial [Candidatus Dadabacteria bacterium]